MTQGMHTAMDICVVLSLIVGNGFDDRRRLLRGCGTIEIDEGVCIDVLMQRRKVLATICDLWLITFLQLSHIVAPPINSPRRAAIFSLKTPCIASIGDLLTIAWAKARVSICFASCLLRPRVRK